MMMSLPLHGLFAQVSKWERLGDGLHRNRGQIDWIDFLPLAIVVAVVVIAFTALAKLRQRNDMTTPCYDSNKLFREVCLAHSLDRGSRKLLWRLAQAAQLAQPAEVFLRPSLFQPGRIPSELTNSAGDLEALRTRLF